MRFSGMAAEKCSWLQGWKPDFHVETHWSDCGSGTCLFYFVFLEFLLFFYFNLSVLPLLSFVISLVSKRFSLCYFPTLPMWFLTLDVKYLEILTYFKGLHGSVKNNFFSNKLYHSECFFLLFDQRKTNKQKQKRKKKQIKTTSHKFYYFFEKSTLGHDCYDISV